jgi:hypothetical protein
MTSGDCQAKEIAPVAEEQRAVPPTFFKAFRFWLKLGFISFGGPTGQIALMHEELVEKRKWISEARFLHALNYCMLLPGPEATQLATYIGWLLHKTWGGIVGSRGKLSSRAFSGFFWARPTSNKCEATSSLPPHFPPAQRRSWE